MEQSATHFTRHYKEERFMKKRITAALLLLVMLITMLPAGVFATETGVETVYQVGDQVWIQGTSSSPTGKTAPGTQWLPVLTADGMWESKAGECPTPEHRHTTSCFNAGGVLICGQEIHRHGPICQTKYKYYLWEVVTDTSYIPPETTPTEPDIGGGEDQGPGYSDPGAEYPAGSAYFTLRNTDPEGNPLQDIEYYLLSPNNEVKGNFLTNPNGEIFFGGLQLADGVSAEIWELTQNPPLPDALADYYEHNRSTWNVTVVRSGDSDSFFVSGIALKEDAASENLLESGNVLTVVNEHKVYDLMVTLKTEGLDGRGIPDGMTARVTIEKDNGESFVVELPDGANFQAYRTGLAAGTYTVTDIAYENAGIEGYTLGNPYVVVALPKPSEDAERPILEQDYIELGSDCAYPDFWITFPYTEGGEVPPAVEVSNTIQVEVVDDSGAQISGTTVTLMDGENIIEEFNDDTGYTLNLEKHGVPGETVSYSLLQTEVPEGYEIAPERYIVEIGQDRNGEPKVVLKKDQSFLQNVASFFTGDGVVIDPETGAQMATFTNVRKTTQIRLTCTVDVHFEAGTWRDAVFEEDCKTENSFRLTWTDSDGTEYQEDMLVAHGETKGFEALVPYGASYKVEALSAIKGMQEILGKVELSDLEEPIHFDAKGQYTVEAGESQPLTLVMVDSEDLSKTLAGVPFELEQEGVDGTIPYTTDKNGRILLQADYTEPVSFTLTQTGVPEGYLKLNGPIQVDVSASYMQKDESDPYVLVQNFVPEVSHESVDHMDDVYYIKNVLKETGTVVEGEHSNQLLISAVTESGSPVEGTQVTMTCPDGSKKTYTGGDVIDLEALGMVGTYNLVQSKSVAGHMIATETYAVSVSQKNGKLNVKVENTNQGLLDKLFNKKEIPFGPNNEWVLTFTNVRQTAKIELTCEVVVNFTGGSWHDLDFEKKYKEETEYEFLLSWDDGYAREQESATLVHGELHNFQLEVPYGVEYEIECVNEKGYFDTTFTGAKSTAIGASELKEEENRITGRNTYIIEPNPDADPIEMHLVKVDATTKKPLAGVEFELLDADNRKLASYTTGADGKVDILDTLKIGGSYGLKETKALSGYETPGNPYGIEVDAEYTLFTASGKPVLKQSFTASISNKAVEEQEDGSYMVKNYKKGQTPKDESGDKGSNPKTADSFDVVLWGGIMAFSLAGISLMAAAMTKKRRSR